MIQIGRSIEYFGLHFDEFLENSSFISGLKNMGCVFCKCCKPCLRRFDENDTGNRESDQHGVQGMAAGTEKLLEVVSIPSHNYNLEYSVLTQKGYYPDSPDKDNQDSYCIKMQLQSNPNAHFFGVFDGHGQFGTQCSKFVKDRLVERLSNDPTLLEDPVKAYHNAFLATNDDLHNSVIDDTMSGTTAITALVAGDILYVANVGDSRAVIAVKDGSQIVARDLSRDQTPFRKDEYERVKLCGARVLSVDQVEGLKDPNIQMWGDEETEGGDPPRLWVQNGMYPGTAFTRSVGDSTAENIGVIAVPEVSVVRLTADHLFFVVASDGVFEFLSSQAVANMVARYPDPRDACSKISEESCKLWLTHENRTDDITIIVVHIKGLSNSGAEATDGITKADAKLTILGNGASDTSGMSYCSARSTLSEPSRPITSVD
ncbi:hypothetical protein Nepgr_031121 [Nepenthes gracilis]|uniref:protein-serine/threonine phosphatase n=1 Tax=Nepenthes gracilis TaxID=150966 RepID=A0AAD3Y4V6_NEPGR|nr:hypothetical protein Nepgr_031121 [Nepenthes gracilis]